jgi:predicted ribosomally synthesized peptide with SipW-like signal peptide
MRRIGLLTLALVLALGSLGVAYAAWTDTITIEGSINTGNVDLNVVDYSGTWIYKNLTTDELVNIHGWMDDMPAEDPNMLLVASATSAAGPEDDSVVIAFNNVFPCQWLTADFLLRYDGSIPVKLWAEIVEGSVIGDQALIDSLDVEFIAYKLPKEFVLGDNPHEYDLVPVDIGVQMHDGDFLLVAMRIHLPQNNELMNMKGEFAAKIVAVQWNQYEWWLAGEPTS